MSYLQELYKFIEEIERKEDMNENDIMSYITLRNCIKGMMPTTKEDNFILAAIYFSEGNMDETKKYLVQCLLQDKNYVEGYNLFVRVYIKQKNFHAARTNLEKVIALNPQDKDALDDLGNLYDELGQYKEALECFDSLIKIDKSYISAYNNKAITLKKLHRRRQAMSQLLLAIEIDKQNPDDKKYKQLYYNIALLYKRKKQYQNSLDNFAKAIDIDPCYTSARIDRSKLYIKLKIFSAAMLDLDIANISANAEERVNPREIEEITSYRQGILSETSSTMRIPRVLSTPGLFLPQLVNTLASCMAQSNGSVPSITICVDSYYANGAPLTERARDIFINQIETFPSRETLVRGGQFLPALAGATSPYHFNSLVEPINSELPFSTMFDFLKWYNGLRNDSAEYQTARAFENHLLKIFKKMLVVDWTKDIVILIGVRDSNTYLNLLPWYVNFLKTSTQMELSYWQGLANLLYVGCCHNISPGLKDQILDVLKYKNIFINSVSQNEEENLLELEIWSRLLESFWINNIRLEVYLKERLEEVLKEYEAVFKKNNHIYGFCKIEYLRQLLLKMDNIDGHPAKQAIYKFGLGLKRLSHLANNNELKAPSSSSSNMEVVYVSSKLRDTDSIEKQFIYLYQQRTNLLLLTIEALVNSNSDNLDDYIERLYAEKSLLTSHHDIYSVYEFLAVIKQVSALLNGESYRIIHQSYFRGLLYLLSNTNCSLQIEICSTLIYFSKTTGELSGINEALRFIQNSQDEILQEKFNSTLTEVLIALWGWLDVQKQQIDAIEDEKKYIEINQYIIIGMIEKKWNLLHEQINSLNFLNKVKCEIKESLICLLVMKELAKNDDNIREEIDKLLSDITEIFKRDSGDASIYQNIYQQADEKASLHLKKMCAEQSKLMELIYVAWDTFPDEYKRFLILPNADVRSVSTTVPDQKHLIGKAKRTFIGVLRENETTVGVRTKEEAESIPIDDRISLQKRIKSCPGNSEAERRLCSIPPSIPLVRKTQDLFVGLYSKDGITIVRDELAMQANQEFTALMREVLDKSQASINDDIFIQHPAGFSTLPLRLGQLPQAAPVTVAPRSCYFGERPQQVRVSSTNSESSNSEMERVKLAAKYGYK
jgi:Tfp pilus assembly protein PilF